MWTIKTLEEAVSAQAAINRFLASQSIKDLVGDYGEILAQKALGGARQTAVTKGFDILHPELNRIEVKTRQYELLSDGTIRKESRAVGFKGKEGGFDWLVHVVLDPHFYVVGACCVNYRDVWPEVLRTKDKIGFPTSSRLPSSYDITEKLRTAQRELGFKAAALLLETKGLVTA